MAPVELTPEDVARAKEAMRELRARVLSIKESERDSWVKAMKPVHDMMIANMRQYEGRQKSVASTKVERSGTADVDGPPILRATRSKTDLVEARQADMLFPTAQAQWRFDPEPEQPEYIKAALLKPEEYEAIASKEALDLLIKEKVQQRTKRLENVIRDQFVESKFPAISRKVIRDATRLGFGLYIAPLTVTKQRERFVQKRIDSQVEQQSFFKRIAGAVTSLFGGGEPQATPVEVEIDIEYEEEVKPGIAYGNPFMFFPQPVEDLSKASGSHYLELMTEQELRELSTNPDADAEEIASLIETKVIEYGYVHSMLVACATQTGIGESLEGRYPVWRYDGRLSHEQMKTLSGCECDPLKPAPWVQMWYCMGRVLLFKTMRGCNRIPFHVYAPNADIVGWWGLGVPWLCKDSARSAQASYEIGLHNLSVSSGPLVFYRDDIEPADGVMEIRGPKMIKVPGEIPLGDMVQVVTIPNNAEQAFAAMERSLALMDEDINLPQFTNPEVNKPTNTAAGMAMWINAQTVVQRRAAAAFDDCIQPMLAEFVKWNRMYSDDTDLQVDVQVVPLGQSELLVKDVQLQHALAFIQLAQAGGPLHGRVNMDVLSAHVAQKFEVPEGTMLTAEEIKKQAENQPVDPAAEMERLKLELLQRDKALAEAKLQADIQDKQRDDDFRAQDRMLDHKERMAELAAKDREMQLQALKLQQQRDLALITLAQERELAVEDIRAKLQMDESNIALQQYITSFKGTIESQKLAGYRAEMALKLSPENPTNQGV